MVPGAGAKGNIIALQTPEWLNPREDPTTPGATMQKIEKEGLARGATC
jgi:hypothetical protein